MSSTANAASVGQIRSGLRALGESLRRGRRKVCPVLGLIEIETASKSLFSLSVQNVSVYWDTSGIWQLQFATDTTIPDTTIPPLLNLEWVEQIQLQTVFSAVDPVELWAASLRAVHNSTGCA